jgi:type IV fimbrial biogenesis protein FimT
MSQLKPSTKKPRGFTLIELMVTLSLMGILMALAIPSFQQLIASQRLSSATNELYVSLLQARSVNGTQTWTQGWITFVDSTRTTANPSVDANETKTFVVQGLSDNLIIKGNLGYVSFSADGQPRSMLGGPGNGTLRVCSSSSSLSDAVRARDLVINAVGRVTIKKTDAPVISSCPYP